MRLVCNKQKHRTLTSELIVKCGLFADMGSSPALTEFRAQGEGLHPRTLTPVMVLGTDPKFLAFLSVLDSGVFLQVFQFLVTEEIQEILCYASSDWKQKSFHLFETIDDYTAKKKMQEAG